MNKLKYAPDGAAAGALPKRSEIPEELTWNLADVYPDAEAWEADFRKAEELADKFASYRGKLTESAQTLLEAMNVYKDWNYVIDAVSGYASMLSDQDVRESKGQAMEIRLQTAYTQMQEKMSFFEPEILTLTDEQIAAFYAQEPGLEEYRVTLSDVLRTREHTLSAEMEALLASAGDMASTASTAFSRLINGDLTFPAVKNPTTGEEVQLSNGRFVPITQSTSDRGLRKAAFEALYTRYKEFGNTWAALYDGQVKQQIFYAKARKYNSTFEAAVDRVDVSPKVCDNLIESVHKNGFEKMHRYVRLRKKMLGVDELHMYDVYAPMVKDYEKTYSYEEAKELTLKALEPLGEDYLAIVRRAYDERWIDVCENEGKRGGAYSGGTYSSHPYMLLNYNNSLDDVFTLIHEMGHSMHTWYSNHAQNVLNANYKIFVAEVASTTNEILLLEYMLKEAKSKEERMSLINHYLESFKGTLFRQTMFEEFERKTNAMAEAGEPLTFEALSSTYLELNKAYFGPDMVSDDLIAYEWARIPHFYYNFYVYQYATSFSAAVAIAHRILEQGAPVVEQYKEFLKGGCTQDPVSLLKIAGVDLSTSAPIDEALEVFEQAIEMMEKELN